MAKYKGTSLGDQEILKTISYITDDKYIASYHGVDVRRVIDLRKKMDTHKEKVAKAIYVSEKTAPSGMNSDSERRWNANAKEGSAELRDALFKFFEKRMLEKAVQERGQ
jgi:predicted oxidoreductase (fatty acid repression mutant protein)